MKKLLSVSDLSKQTGVTEPTVYRYLNDFSEFFEARGGARGKKYDENATFVLTRIKQLLDEGLTKQKARKILINEFAINSDNNEQNNSTNNRSTLVTSDDLLELHKKLDSLIEDSTLQKQFNQVLVTKLDEQQQFIDNNLIERDKKLMETLREIQETKRLMIETNEGKNEIAATNKKKWWQFWK